MDASVDPRPHWERQLQALLPAVVGSAYGRHIGLDRVKQLDDLKHLPITGWEEVAPWIERVARGEPDVLTTEPVQLLEPTGGSTGGTKLIPYTARLKSEFDEAVGAWMVDLHHRDPLLFGRRHYWSVSRAVKQPATSEGGLPIGLTDDAEYFGPVTRWVLGQIFVVPPDVAHAPSLDAWRSRTLGYLLDADDLGLISVWSPTFLSRLIDAVPEVEGLSADARQRVDRWMDTGNLMDLFPALRLLSAWGDGFARDAWEELTQGFPGAQPKGLLATEGVVSIPWGHAPGSVVLPTHLIELRNASGEVTWPWEAEVGARYQPLMSTGSGLIRYALPDQVEVVGFLGRLPRIRVVGRLDRGSDLVGEKLTPGFVQPIVAALPGFAMLFPKNDRYVLVTEAPVEPRTIDEQLQRAHHYAYARELDQLAQVEVRVVPDAWARWEAACEARGLTLGDQKPGPLETRLGMLDAILGS